MSKKQELPQTSPFDLSKPEIRAILGLDKDTTLDLAEELGQSFLGLAQEHQPKGFDVPVTLMNGQAINHYLNGKELPLQLPKNVFEKCSSLVFSAAGDASSSYLIIGILSSKKEPKFLLLQKDTATKKITSFKGLFISEENVRTKNRKVVRFSDLVKVYSQAK